LSQEILDSAAPEQQVNPDAVFLLSELPLEVRLVQGNERGSLAPNVAEGRCLPDNSKGHQHTCMLLQILSSIAGFLGSPQDLFSCILTSQQLRAAVHSSRMSFELKGRPRQLLSFPSQTRQLDDLVQSLTHYMPGVAPGARSLITQLYILIACCCRHTAA
jgi:hypothetical protein